MSGPLETSDWLPETGAKPGAGDTRPQPGLLAQAAAAMRVQVDTVGEVQDERRARSYQPLIEALIEHGLSRDYLMRGGGFIPGADIASGLDLPNYDTVFREAKRLGLTDANGAALPATRQDFERSSLRRNGGRDADQALLARGSGIGATIAQFSGGMFGSFRDPVNIAMLPFGGGGRTAAVRILSEAAVNTFGATVALPGTAHAYEQLGEDFTAGDAALEVGMAAAGGAVIRGGIEAAPKVDALGNRALRPVRERFDQFFKDTDLARAAARMDVGGVVTPEQQAAIHVLTREEEIDRSSPYARTIAGDELHRSKVREAAERLGPRVVRGPGNLHPQILEFFRRKGYTEGQARGITAGIMAESRGGDPSAVNPTSGALGLGQWLGTRKAEIIRRYGPNPSMQQQLEFVHWELQGGDHGGRHVLARSDEAEVLRAYITKFMRPAEGAETTGDLSRGMAALGRGGEQLPAEDASAGIEGLDLGDDAPVIRPEALDAERPFVSSAGRQIPVIALKPSEIDVDAELMQFKSGGDRNGVTERLQGVQEWDPVAAGTVTVWQPLEGRPLIADGHQRLGLARRIAGAGGDEPVLNAFVLREADGYTARDARIITALKNIGEGTGSAIDAAKVLREAGDYAAQVEKRLPPRSALVRDGKALARLSDEAFGAVVNEVIPEGYAAAIGHLAPDPDTHLALVALLHKSEPANRRQAEAIVRQALDAGFTKETQEELFGARDLTNSLFALKAKLLDRTLGELKRLKGAFGVAARNADALEGAGNSIDVAGSEAAAAANARALGLVDRLALRKGNAVNEALDQAAKRLAAGEPLARVTRELVAAIRGFDLADLERSHGSPGGAGDGAFGRGRAELDPVEAGAAESPSDLTPADVDAIEAEQDLGPSLFDEGTEAARAFDDDAGEGVKAAAESDWHDIRAAADPRTAVAEFKAAIDGEAISGPADDPAELEHLSNREVAETLAAEVIDEAIDAHALKIGRELRPAGNLDEIHAELSDLAEGPLAGDREKLTRAAEKAIRDGRLELEDLGEPELTGPNPNGAKGSIVPPPEQPVKAADYAGDYMDPAEAKARVDEWKAEAQRIGRESPPAPGTVIISLFDASGQFSKPYREMGYEVVQLDIKGGHDILRNLAYYVEHIRELKAKGGKVAGVLAQPPCTTFAGSGARWWDERHNRSWANAVRKMWGEWAAKLFDSPVEYNQFLVAATEEIIHAAEPAFYVMENPRGRIAKLNGLPKPLLTIEPHHFGDPYTKNTSLYGEFNPELPTANVDPVEGSRMHKLRGRDEKDDGLRSLTPEGFAYAFALANRPGTDAAEKGATKAVTLELDRGAVVDPAIADRQRQQAELGAKSPLRGKAEQDGTGGLGLFDHADEPTFDLDDGKGPRTAAEIEAEIEADKAGLEEIKKCLI